MGILIGDTIEITRTGLSITGAYASFCTNEIRLEKREEKMTDAEGVETKTVIYTVRSVARIWKDADARTCEKHPLDGIMVQKTLTTEEMNTNLYTVLYNELKSKYTTTTDC